MFTLKLQFDVFFAPYTQMFKGEIIPFPVKKVIFIEIRIRKGRLGSNSFHFFMIF